MVENVNIVQSLIVFLFLSLFLFLYCFDFVLGVAEKTKVFIVHVGHYFFVYFF